MNNISNYSRLEDFGRVRLSTHFFMRDFLYSEIALWNGLRNVPDYPDRAINAGTQLCETLLEPLQATFGRIHIRSGYRSPSVNEFGNKNQLNCANNESNYAAHIWDYPDAFGKQGATACIVVPWLVDHIERGGKWTDMAWWIHDHLPYSTLYFFPRLSAFNINWHETPVRRVDSYVQPKGCLIRPGTIGCVGLHADQYQGFPSVKTSPSKIFGAPTTKAKADVIPAVVLSSSQFQELTVGAKTASKAHVTAAKPSAAINYRAVHSKSKWRKVNSHQSIESAINGVNGAIGLFAKRVRIDYEKHGDPLFVLVWESDSSNGFALRKDPNQPGGMRKVPVSTEKLMGFERRGAASEYELNELFG